MAAEPICARMCVCVHPCVHNRDDFVSTHVEWSHKNSCTMLFRPDGRLKDAQAVWNNEGRRFFFAYVLVIVRSVCLAYLFWVVNPPINFSETNMRFTKTKTKNAIIYIFFILMTNFHDCRTGLSWLFLCYYLAYYPPPNSETSCDDGPYPRPTTGGKRYFFSH